MKYILRYSVIRTTSANLKHIAMASMLIDHIAVIFLSPGTAYYVCRLLGRLAFPLYAYLAAKGAEKSSNRMKYAARLLALTLVSQVPYSLAFYGQLLSLSAINAAASLFLGVAAIIAVEKTAGIPMKSLFLTAAAILSYLLKFEYGPFYLCLIFLIYFFRTKISKIIIIEAKGRQLPKALYYLFYPVHLLLLYFMASIIR